MLGLIIQLCVILVEDSVMVYDAFNRGTPNENKSYKLCRIYCSRLPLTFISNKTISSGIQCFIIDSYSYLTILKQFNFTFEKMKYFKYVNIPCEYVIEMEYTHFYMKTYL